MKVFVTGGTGFVGRPLVARLAEAGHEVVVATRSARSSERPRVRYVAWDAKTQGAWAREVDGAEVVIHLAGEGIFERRWTPEIKRDLRGSRIASTRAVVTAIEAATARPKALLSASAVGYYGDTQDRIADEDSAPGHDFLADVCVQWEREARRAADLGVRVVLLRIGVVLGPDGGALKQMVPPFRAFLGGPMGSGKQWFPWVHVRDVVQAIELAATRDTLSGPYNIVAPETLRMADFCRGLGRALGRPSWLPMPAPVVRLALGERGDALLTGQRLSVRRLQDAGYSFAFPTLDAALRDLLRSSGSA
jgi:uncharacterized protein (TIGR01777 family)